MRLYQPVLYMGLGGTGCDIGAELESRLREEICGPDGTEFSRKRAKAGLLPYQLPSCLQFVYADMNQADLDRMPRRVVPGSQYEASARLTAQYVRDLIPRVDSYPDLARNLRLGSESLISGWLPPPEKEPRVNPLQRGAGQFPTVGRAALFGTCISGLNPAVHAITEAIGRLANSAEDLYALGGRPPKAVDVFVAFSVAGGTGCGIFYDYLHLIGHVFDETQLKAKIYPLVLMPSAFDLGLGGGRSAELNSGRAMLDMFRLVDSQNGAHAEQELRSHHDKEPGDPDEQAIYYPVVGRIALRPGTVQTGFLFSRPAGADREDLHRSVTSLVTSLIGTELEQEDQRSGESVQSFADSFVNAGAHREAPAENGIGNRGVSTALVASLTVPVDEIAGLVAGRLVRTAIKQLARPGKPESNESLMSEFLIKSGVNSILTRSPAEFDEPGHVQGASKVAAALADRRDAQRSGLSALKNRLDRDIPAMVRGFDPRRAVRELLAKNDAFRVQRAVFGHAELTDEIEREGAVGLLQRRRADPPAPDGHGVAPPNIPQLSDRMLGMRKVQYADPEPTAFRERQDDWYRWRTAVAWTQLWAAHATTWQRPLDVVRREMDTLTKELDDFARNDEDRYDRRARDLYRRRVGVSYLLPPGGASMDEFYNLVIRRLADAWATQGRVQVNSAEPELLQVIVGASGWSDAYNQTFEHNATQAVSDLVAKVKEEVKTFLRETNPGQLPLLPQLRDLLPAAAGIGESDSAYQDYLDEFRGKLAGLVPANFAPQGNGPMKVLISYPAPAKSPAIADYLRQSINLPEGHDVTYDPRHTYAESIAVVLFRSSMGVTEVREVREVLRLWAGAVRKEQPTDKLYWRQRTGYDFGYLATREEHRVEILHRLLCGMWNGRVEAVGEDESSPERILVTLAGNVKMNLPLTPFGQASSWGSLIRSYELWTFDDSQVHRLFCAQLMQELPAGLDARPKQPSELYLAVRDLAKSQIEILDELVVSAPRGSQTRASQMRGFWATTMPAALTQAFDGSEAPVASNLAQLADRVAGPSHA